jgi:hypothetical protein
MTELVCDPVGNARGRIVARGARNEHANGLHPSLKTLRHDDDGARRVMRDLLAH